jgi:hypothetical protein
MIKKILSTGLASAVLGGALVALPAAASAAPASPWPTSCADVKSKNLGSYDGEYDITVNDALTTVHCADMATSPTEYVTLDVPNTASTAAGGAWEGETSTTTYSKLRLLLPDATHPEPALTSDFRFSSSAGVVTRYGSTVADRTAWPMASSCSNFYDQSGYALGDLTGTNWSFTDPASAMSTQGYAASGGVVVASPQRFEVSGGGYCGGTYPVTSSRTGSGSEMPVSVTGSQVTDVPVRVSGTVGEDELIHVSTSAVNGEDFNAMVEFFDGATWHAIGGVDSTGPDFTIYSMAFGDRTEVPLRVRLYKDGSYHYSRTHVVKVVGNALVANVETGSTSSSVKGSDFVLEGSTTGTTRFPLTYAWDVSKDGGSTWTALTETGSTLVVAGLTTADSGQYRLRASAAGVTYEARTDLAVDLSAPVLPKGLAPTTTITEGQALSLEVTAAATDELRYQWYRLEKGDDRWLALDGASSPTFSLEHVKMSDDGARFRVSVTAVDGAYSSTSTESTTTLAVQRAYVAPPVAAFNPKAAVSASNLPSAKVYQEAAPRATFGRAVLGGSREGRLVGTYVEPLLHGTARVVGIWVRYTPKAGWSGTETVVIHQVRQRADGTFYDAVTTTEVTTKVIERSKRSVRPFSHLVGVA